MIFKSAKSPRLMLLMLLAELLVLGLAILTFLYFDTIIKYILVIFELFVVFIIAATALDTHYELRESSLYLRSGLLKSEIPYSDIQTAARTRGYTFFMALAINRLELNAGIHPENGKIILSPENEDAFLEELSRRCPNMVITQ